MIHLKKQPPPPAPRVQLSRAYKFRLYPTPVQEAELSEWSFQLRRLWNLALDQRKQSLARTLPLSMGKGFCRHCGAELPKTKTDPPAAHTAACSRADYYRQSTEMTALLTVDDQLARVVCCARQEVLRDLDRAWQRCFKKLAGQPKFKGRHDRVRIYFSTPKHWQVLPGSLLLKGAASSVGPIKIEQDRPWPKDAKFSSCHIVRDVDRWFAVFPLAFETDLVPAKPRAVGINRGMIHAIADSDGRIVDSPRFYGHALGVIQKRSRAMARKVKRGNRPQEPTPRFRSYRGREDELRVLAERLGTSCGNVIYQIKKRGSLDAAVAYLLANPPKPASTEPIAISAGMNRNKALVRLRIAHRKVRLQREHWLHQQSAHYSKNYALIGIEDWSTKEMTSSELDGKLPRVAKRAMNRGILDVGWYELGRQIKYKAEATGARLVPVEPGLVTDAAFGKDGSGDEPGISSVCSVCGEVFNRAISGSRKVRCAGCDSRELGDLNAATNVLHRAQATLPPDPKRPKVSIKIKGRTKVQPETTDNRSVESCGGDSPVQEPVEAAMSRREA